MEGRASLVEDCLCSGMPNRNMYSMEVFKPELGVKKITNTNRKKHNTRDHQCRTLRIVQHLTVDSKVQPTRQLESSRRVWQERPRQQHSAQRAAHHTIKGYYMEADNL